MTIWGNWGAASAAEGGACRWTGLAVVPGAVPVALAASAGMTTACLQRGQVEVAPALRALTVSRCWQ